MLTLVVTLVASIAPAPAGAADATCDDDKACEAPAEDADRAYATPAVVDCREAASLTAFVGECDGTIIDMWYRASRSPELAQVTRALQPASRERRRTVAACDALPPKGPTLTISSGQPVAVFATPTLVPIAAGAVAMPETFELVSRFRDPPDRPPRV
jgi:hypothetical protein